MRAGYTCKLYVVPKFKTRSSGWKQNSKSEISEVRYTESTSSSPRILLSRSSCFIISKLMLRIYSYTAL